jgi:tetratricopeptide (TPR) repeat protein
VIRSAGEIAWLVAYSLMRSDQAAEAIELVRQTLARPGISPAQAARLTALPAAHLAVLGEVDEAARIAASALRLTEQAGDGLAAGYARHALACVRWSERNSTGIIEQIDQGPAAVGDDPQALHLRLLLLSNKISILTDLDRPSEALAVARQALILAEQTGTSKDQNIRVRLSRRYFEAGQWDDAIAEAEQAAAVGAERPNHDLMRGSLLALIAGCRGDPETAAGHLSEITPEQILRPHNRPMVDLVWGAQAVLAEQRGDQEEAIAVLGRGLEPDLAGLLPDHYLLLPMLTRLALAGGKGDIAAAEAAAREAAPRKVATAGHCRGLLAGDPAPVLAAAAYWESAGQPGPGALRRGRALQRVVPARLPRRPARDHPHGRGTPGPRRGQPRRPRQPPVRRGAGGEVPRQRREVPSGGARGRARGPDAGLS